MRNAVVVPYLLVLLLFFFVYLSSTQTVFDTQCATTLTGPGGFCPTNNCARRVRVKKKPFFFLHFR